jgi:hypothetical protein
MRTQSDVANRIKVDFFNRCTGGEAEDVADIPRAFLEVMEQMDQRAMRAALVRLHLLKKRQSSEAIGIRYGITGAGVRSAKKYLSQTVHQVNDIALGPQV